MTRDAYRKAGIRFPKYLAELEAEYGLEQFETARKFFEGRGVSVAYVPRKGWRFYCIGRQDGPTCVICWVGLGGMIDMLDSPSETLKIIHDNGGSVRL